MYPHVSTLDVISTHPSPCPPRFAPNLQSAFVFQDGLFHDQDIIPTTLAHWPRLRHLGLHGNHSYCHKAWYALVNHPALQTLVTDFEIHSFASGCVPMRAPALTSWTTSNYVLGFMFDLASAEPCWDSGDMFTALEDLKLVVDVWSTEAMMGHPGHNSEIPPIPYSRIGSRLRTFEVVESHQFTQDLWLQIASSSFASQLVTFGLVQTSGNPPRCGLPIT
ncbi:hypothetical protein BCR44DRAFT_351586 [Catenaria anguillulae PL171]|uniref:F-box domain-containing protein n=1 Tax=Catenaria anguillulae PL171 TaxID=765915 RepID=A0A1Y2H8C5_9FUNG|nr:hypothetical protein BCR44DRAFT_351586 [Catenaria anguillulae PL171]